jgi:hypothetical protein
VIHALQTVASNKMVNQIVSRGVSMRISQMIVVRHVARSAVYIANIAVADTVWKQS